jgi:hypothetical protein
MVKVEEFRVEILLVWLGKWRFLMNCGALLVDFEENKMSLFVHIFGVIHK